MQTSSGGSTTTYGMATFDGRPAFCVNWIGQYQVDFCTTGGSGNDPSKTTSYQLLIVDRSDVGYQDFDIVFNYGSMQWDHSVKSTDGGVCAGPAGAGYSLDTPGSGQLVSTARWARTVRTPVGAELRQADRLDANRSAPTRSEARGYSRRVPRLVGINHVAVEVADVEEEIAFFSRIFDDVELRGRAGNMAFMDMGDQFVALESVAEPVSTGHYGLVVDDRDEVVGRARDAGARMVGGHDFLDPSGNRWQVVDYRDVQFTKAPRVLEGMSLSHLEKSERALAELRTKGLAD